MGKSGCTDGIPRHTDGMLKCPFDCVLPGALLGFALHKQWSCFLSKLLAKVAIIPFLLPPTFLLISCEVLGRVFALNLFGCWAGVRGQVHTGVRMRRGRAHTLTARCISGGGIRNRVPGNRFTRTFMGSCHKANIQRMP
jgi:hypothetical protein